MSRALTAEGAELHLFQTLRHRLFVTGRGVVPALAFAARQNREITHCFILSSSSAASGLQIPPAPPVRPLSAGIAGRHLTEDLQ